MICGVRFCGGCNPRYDRGKALQEIKEHFAGNEDISIVIAEEGVYHDYLLVIGGCTNCCASYEQFETHKGVIKMWDQEHIENTIKIMEDFNE